MLVTRFVEGVPLPDGAEKFAMLGDLLGRLHALPYEESVKGDDGSGLRELRPRAGRSRWRPIYRQVGSRTFVILSVAPEAVIDSRGFDEKVRDARRRFDQLET